MLKPLRKRAEKRGGSFLFITVFNGLRLIIQRIGVGEIRGPGRPDEAGAATAAAIQLTNRPFPLRRTGGCGRRPRAIIAGKKFGYERISDLPEQI